MTYRPTNNRGFTLFEITIVMIIISLLAAAVVPNLLNRPRQARHIVSTQDLQSISLAISLFELDHGFLPPNPNGLAILVNPETLFQDNQYTTPYLSRLPIDPWGTPYYYEKINDRNYRICTLGADSALGGSGDQADQCYP